jgi:hypothetical protein
VSFYQRSLVISEIMYHPAGLNGSREYIELLNIGRSEVDLTPLRFTKGIDFDFAGSDVTTLAPGARVLVVRSLTAFKAVYGNSLPVAGATADNLDNEGERIKLSYGAGTTIIDFDYDDVPPWPASPDGGGPSLVLIDPYSAPDHRLAGNWRASHSSGGNPGTTDAAVFTGDPAVDLDRDGVPALLEFALGGRDDSPADLHRLPRMEWHEVGGNSFPVLAFDRPRDLEGPRYSLQISSDLASWSDHEPVNDAVIPQPPGDTIPVRFRSPAAIANAPKQFLRLKVELAAP